jgi:hypothetical protein
MAVVERHVFEAHGAANERTGAVRFGAPYESRHVVRSEYLG